MAIAIRKAPLQQTARYRLDSLSTDPDHPIRLTVRQANENNGPYWSEVIRDIGEGRSPSGSRPTAAEMQRGREDYADRYARHVVTAWEGVFDETGKAVPCTPTAVREFFALMLQPGENNWHDAFDSLRAWCQNADNFRATVSPVDLGKG